MNSVQVSFYSIRIVADTFSSCTFPQYGVGNWKAILNDPELRLRFSADRHPGDLKDRFRTKFPEAYHDLYPNAKTHIATSSSRRVSEVPKGHFEKGKSKERRCFTAAEDATLKQGYELYGSSWTVIAKDPIFEGRRKPTDLRDRFRNAFPDLYEQAGYKPRVKGGKSKDRRLSHGSSHAPHSHHGHAVPLPKQHANANADLDSLVLAPSDQSSEHAQQYLRPATTRTGSSPSHILAADGLSSTNESDAGSASDQASLPSDIDWLAYFNRMADQSVSTAPPEMARSLSFGSSLPAPGSFLTSAASSSSPPQQQQQPQRPSFLTQLSLPAAAEGLTTSWRDGFSSEQSITSASSEAESIDFSLPPTGAGHGKSISEQDARGRMALWHLKQAQMIQESLRADAAMEQRHKLQRSSIQSSRSGDRVLSGAVESLRRTQSSKRAKAKVGGLVSGGNTSSKHSDSPWMLRQQPGTDPDTTTAPGASQSLPPSHAAPANFDPDALGPSLDDQQLRQVNAMLESHAAESARSGSINRGFDEERGDPGPPRSASSASSYAAPLPFSQRLSPLGDSHGVRSPGIHSNLFVDPMTRFFESLSDHPADAEGFAQAYAPPETQWSLQDSRTRSEGIDSALSTSSADVLSANSIASGSEAGRFSERSDGGQGAGYEDPFDRLNALTDGNVGTTSERRSFMTSNFAAMQLASSGGGFEGLDSFRNGDHDAIKSATGGGAESTSSHEREWYENDHDSRSGHSVGPSFSSQSGSSGFAVQVGADEDEGEDMMPRTDTIQPRKTQGMYSSDQLFDATGRDQSSAANDFTVNNPFDPSHNHLANDAASIRRPRSSDTLREQGQPVSSELLALFEASPTQSFRHAGTGGALVGQPSTTLGQVPEADDEWVAAEPVTFERNAVESNGSGFDHYSDASSVNFHHQSTDEFAVFDGDPNTRSLKVNGNANTPSTAAQSVDLGQYTGSLPTVRAAFDGGDGDDEGAYSDDQEGHEFDFDDIDLSALLKGQAPIAPLGSTSVGGLSPRSWALAINSPDDWSFPDNEPGRDGSSGPPNGHE